VTLGNLQDLYKSIEVIIVPTLQTLEGLKKSQNIALVTVSAKSHAIQILMLPGFCWWCTGQALLLELTEITDTESKIGSLQKTARSLG